MRIANASAVLVLLSALTFARAEPLPTPKADDPPGFLEVPVIGTVEVFGKLSFNEGRQYAICVNRHVPDAKESRAKLVTALHKQKQLDQVVFEWFGKKPPARLNLWVGDKVPVEVVQAVVATYAADTKLAVHIELITKDEQPGNTRTVFVGGLVDCDTDPVTPKQLQELLKPGLTSEQFAKLLLKKRD